ncbi:hypothetical protein KHQ06_23945 [Nocardia tengchongensis]|uniref:Uncharacterized protein n=1 Tax=Nocardia tengchongensis TaxID=2055889 RepID=A0ABX8CHI8_9NOCA|nr:hypothetical protein [Nocardia tengchongensis]QVI19429.1 hypothetical protein KHQ06_23945 [Nocardia tengchongensis]
MSTLLTEIRDHLQVAEFLRWPGDFDLDRTEHVEEVHLASGARLEAIAGDAGGGTFFFCGEGGDERPILYADSEGQAGLVAVGLRELLQLLLVVPWWRDCRSFSVEESRESAEEFLEDIPDLLDERDQAAVVFGLSLPTESEVLERLRGRTAQAGQDQTLIFTAEGTAYEPLFNV